MITYEQMMEEVRRRKRERWLKILSSEPANHAPGRRPRNPDKERLLLKLDRARLARRKASGVVCTPVDVHETDE